MVEARKSCDENLERNFRWLALCHNFKSIAYSTRRSATLPCAVMLARPKVPDLWCLTFMVMLLLRSLTWMLSTLRCSSLLVMSLSAPGHWLFWSVRVPANHTSQSRTVRLGGHVLCLARFMASMSILCSSLHPANSSMSPNLIVGCSERSSRRSLFSRRASFDRVEDQFLMKRVVLREQQY